MVFSLGPFGSIYVKFLGLQPVPLGQSIIENDAHGIEKPSKMNKFLHSEVNLLIQHIIV